MTDLCVCGGGGMNVFVVFALLINCYKRDIGSVQSVRKNKGILITPGWFEDLELLNPTYFD